MHTIETTRRKPHQPALNQIALALSGLILASCSHVPEQASIAASARYEDFADDWMQFHDATQGLPMEQRTAAFDRDLATKFPAFYRDRYATAEDKALLDARLIGSIQAFDAQRDAFAAKHKAFASTLSRNITLFSEAFPDFESVMPIAVVHSLGEMDGGTRTLGDQQWLVFGIDVMVRAHAPDSDGRAFFMHELFHVYHHDRLADCNALWCSLWSEGLAVHVAATLNPGATEQDLLLSLPPDMAPGVRAATAAVARDFLRVFDSEDPEEYSPRFNFSTDNTGLPPRRAYYLGYLVAQRLGADRSVQELAAMEPAAVRPLIHAALEEMAGQ